MSNHTNGRPERLFMIVHGQRKITPAYREYLYNLVHITEEEKTGLRELGIRLDEDSAERIEDFPAVAAFIEGNWA